MVILHGSRCVPSEHLGAVEGEEARAREGYEAGEFIGSHVIGFGPHPKVGVVLKKVGTGRELIAMVGAGRIRGRGDRYALEAGAGARLVNLELAGKPALRHSVIKDDGIAIIAPWKRGSAIRGECIKERVAVYRAEDGVAAPIKYADADIVPLEIVVRPDVALGIRREHT
jgi:hypothetical protein